MKKMTKFTPSEAAKIDAWLEREAIKKKEADFRQELIFRRGPRDRSLIDEILEEQRPEQWSLEALKKRGVEAFRPTRCIGIHGHSYTPEDVLFPWPIAPAPGFATPAQLKNLLGSELELAPGGGRVLESFRLAGHLYQPGDTLETWPELPSEGFIQPMTALQLLRDGELEPAELTPA